ncbi:hypothetical protein [Lactobacillus hominis]|uniref:Holin n=1 Tax=Lactobacillus hominis DSM 23910 = CRBIP 24.179 TaxID=1423758 RepID=I7KH20_9LACO|nr:hypothetical protein [Lactobacillus hominis]KRM85729.1 hypothetical protein FC41_GL001044 [Lactobacillus hominis DSM 23910 = CRBIP 24.179]MCT3347224.1 hypothetical protein [Lactobacillus hominis]CCI81750.1 Putative uncharacterized protein [Lactobacillus hominis DSM 23910 = CRBIP 24.179]
MLKTISDWLPWVAMVVMYVAGKIASYYEYSKKNDPEVANKFKHVGELAKWAVADQSRYSDKAGSVKFDDAVKSLTNQGVDKSMAQGAVQDAYLNSDLPKSEPKPAPAPIIIPKVTDPVEVVPIKPVEDNNAVLDDLEVNNNEKI